MSFQDALNKLKAEQAAADQAQAELKAQEQRDEWFVRYFVRNDVNGDVARYFKRYGSRVYNVNQFPSEVIKVFNEITPHLVYTGHFVIASNYGETYACGTASKRNATCGLPVLVKAWEDYYEEYYLNIVFFENGYVGVSKADYNCNDELFHDYVCDMTGFIEYWSHVNINTFYDAVARAIDDAKKAQSKKRGLFW